MSVASKPIRNVVDLGNLLADCDLTSSLVNSFAEAASVALTNMRHSPPPPPTSAELHYRGTITQVQLSWCNPDKITLNSYNNELDATEFGAYAIAIGIAKFLSKKYRVVARAQQGSGADFLMVADGEPEQNYVKLEVSGTGSEQQESRRLAQKIGQVKSGVAVVVSFVKPKILAQEEA